LGIVRDLRVDHPWVGAVLQAQLRRTEGDCRDLAGGGSRVRLCKGAYDEPASAAFRRGEVDRSFVRCLKVLMAGEGLPMVATHDPRLVEIARFLAERHGRTADDYELQMLYGVRPHAQSELAAEGLRVRVYLPYGTEWFGYFMRRLGERPANLAFFARSLLTRG
jgi:proline dehydrogenase